MMSREKFSEQYNSRVTVSEDHTDEHVESMARTIMKLVVNDLETLGLTVGERGGVQFSVYLREYDLAVKNETTWSAALATRPEISAKSTATDGRGTIALVSRQFYKAFHKLNRDLDYSGYFEVEVITYAIDASEDEPEMQLDPLAKIICRLVHEHYREQIYVYYPEWETDYVDAVNYLLKKKAD